MLGYPGEDDRQERGVRERPVRALVHPVERPVGGRPIGDGPHEDVVVVEQPLDEIPGRRLLPRVAPRAAEAPEQILARPSHVGEAAHRQEDRLQGREDLVLHPSSPVPGLQGLDLEGGVALPAPLLLDAAEGDDPLPLPPDGEHRVDRGVDPHPRPLEVVLEGVEDERTVRGVGLDDGGLERQPDPAADGPRLLLAGVPDPHVDSGEPPVELVGRGDLAGHEPEVAQQPGGHRLRRELEGDTDRHVLEDEGREAENQLPVLGRRLAAQDLRHLGEPLGPLLRLTRSHVRDLLGWRRCYTPSEAQVESRHRPAGRRDAPIGGLRHEQRQAPPHARARAGGGTDPAVSPGLQSCRSPTRTRHEARDLATRGHPPRGRASGR